MRRPWRDRARRCSTAPGDDGLGDVRTELGETERDLAWGTTGGTVRAEFGGTERGVGPGDDGLDNVCAELGETERGVAREKHHYKGQ